MWNAARKTLAKTVAWARIGPGLFALGALSFSKIALAARLLAAGVWQRTDRARAISIGAAFGMHLLAILIITGHLRWPQFLQFAPAPPPSQAPERPGDKGGVLDGVSVETIDAAEYDRRYVSFSKGSDASDSEGAEAQPPQPERQPQQPQQKAEPPPALKPTQPPEDDAVIASPPPTPPKQDTQTLTEADLAEIMASTRLDAETIVRSMSKASIANAGQASEFVRGVLRILKQNMPKSNGVRGSVVIRLLVSPTGSIEMIRVARSSGKPELDRLVLEGVSKTQLVAPAKNSPANERAFEITYDYN